MQTPELLRDQILQRIDAEQSRTERAARQLSQALVALAAIAASVPLFLSLAREVQESGFLTYASFLLSDTAIVLQNWPSYILGLVETAPLLPLTGLLCIAFAVLITLRLTSPRPTLAYAN